MKRCLVAFLWTCGLGCTAHNPEFGGQADGGSATDMARRFDLGVVTLPDLAGGIDLSLPLECMGIPRACTQSGDASERCINGSFVPDRLCPVESTCHEGYCQVPPNNGGVQGEPCSSESDCALVINNLDQSCQPFVIDAMAPPLVELHCAHVIGMGGSGNMCQSGQDCRSGYCLAGKGTCFRACTSDNDCPLRGTVKTVCRPQVITVEGVDFKSDSCVFP